MKIAIHNKGKNNKFTNNTFVGFDVAIKDEGKETIAQGNHFFNNLTSNSYEQRLDQLIRQGEDLIENSQVNFEDMYGPKVVDESNFTQWKTSSEHLLSGYLQKDSAYYQNFNKIDDFAGVREVDKGVGILRAVKVDIQSNIAHPKVPELNVPSKSNKRIIFFISKFLNSKIVWKIIVPILVAGAVALILYKLGISNN